MEVATAAAMVVAGRVAATAAVVKAVAVMEVVREQAATAVAVMEEVKEEVTVALVLSVAVDDGKCFLARNRDESARTQAIHHELL